MPTTRPATARSWFDKPLHVPVAGDEEREQDRGGHAGNGKPDLKQRIAGVTYRIFRWGQRRLPRVTETRMSRLLA